MAIVKLKKKNHQYKRPISTDNIDDDDDKLVVSETTSFEKNRLKYFIHYEDTTKLDLYSYFFQESVHIEKILIKLYVWLFW